MGESNFNEWLAQQFASESARFEIRLTQLLQIARQRRLGENRGGAKTEDSFVRPFIRVEAG